MKRFWDKVAVGEPGECWEWQARKNHMYGQFKLTEQTNQQAHRFAYELMHGKIPVRAVIRHTCDNPGCCNPAHLALGTQGENMADMMLRDRRNYKLDPAKVERIRRLRQEGFTHKAIAKQFDVARSTITRALSGEHWEAVS